MVGWLVYGALRHIQQYFSYVVAVRFIGGGNWDYQEKTTDLSQVKHYHIMLYLVHLAMNGVVNPTTIRSRLPLILLVI